MSGAAEGLVDSVEGLGGSCKFLANDVQHSFLVNDFLHLTMEIGKALEDLKLAYSTIGMYYRKASFTITKFPAIKKKFSVTLSTSK